MKRIIIVIASLAMLSWISSAEPVLYVGSQNNDLYATLEANSVEMVIAASLPEALSMAARGQGIIVTAEGYPFAKTKVSESDWRTASRKNVRVFIEFPDIDRPGLKGEVRQMHLERGVVTSDFFGKELPEMSVLGINGAHVIKMENGRPIMSMAKVAGFDTACFGLENTETFPILFIEGNFMIAATSVSNFITARFAPHDSWKTVIGSIVGWVLGTDSHMENFAFDPVPAWSENEALPASARTESIINGTEWLWNANLFIHPTWARDYISQYQTASNPNHFFGPPVSDEMLQGDGNFGIMEGHASEINYDGTQQYRYFIRADVQGEAAMLLAASGNLTGNELYMRTSENLLDYLFYTSDFRAGDMNDRNSPVFGFIGWANTHLGAFFNDDNARCILGAIGASSYLPSQRWNSFIVENILANYRISSRQGFQGGSLLAPDIIGNGIRYYSDRDFVYPSPHFESWMWACYIWLYARTGYKPLLDKAKTAIKTMMDLYPSGWYAQNGTQQQRARMILPLAWLVRAEDTPEHRKWLDTMVKAVLEYQDESGAIREEIGLASQDSHKLLISSNDDYGKNEAALIAENGDPVADMLYTCNFLFFALNEAAHATGDEEYFAALESLSDFLTRIQVKSSRHKDVDGAWFRAFDYDRWDYWASNADDGWGAWCTLAGWIQSWIVTTQVMLEQGTSYWDRTSCMDVSKEFAESKWMLNY